MAQSTKRAVRAAAGRFNQLTNDELRERVKEPLTESEFAALERVFAQRGMKMPAEHGEVSEDPTPGTRVISLEELNDQDFGLDKRHWEASENRVLDFYGFFGMYESAVKMNLPFASDCDLPYVGRSADKPCSVRFLSDGTTLLTIVTEKPEEIALRVFDTDKAARTLEEIDNPFVPIAGPSCLQP